MAGLRVVSGVGDASRRCDSPRCGDDPGGILLGLEDEIVTEAHLPYVDLTTSFIGGRPLWIVDRRPTEAEVACAVCRRPSVHALQIYAPLYASPYDRVLNLFCCLDARCWRDSRGWLCMRTQKLAESARDVRSGADVENADDWLSGASNWDDDDSGGVEAETAALASLSDEDYANCNVAAGAGATGISFNQQSYRPRRALGAGDVSNGDDDNVSEHKSAPGPRRVSCISAGARDETDEMGEEETAGNSPDAPVTVEDLPGLAAAARESDIPALLFGVGTGAGKGTTGVLLAAERNVCFVRKFLSVVEEPRKDAAADAGDWDLRSVGGCGTGSGTGMGTGQGTEAGAAASLRSDKAADAAYETAAPLHGDRLFWKLTRRLALLPRQILRYNQSGAGAGFDRVLWLKPPPPPLPAARCRSCGAVTRFELQVLPTFFNSLRLMTGAETGSDWDWTPADFGTIVVLTCSRSCWRDADGDGDGAEAKVELCIYQCELD